MDRRLGSKGRVPAARYAGVRGGCLPDRGIYALGLVKVHSSALMASSFLCLFLVQMRRSPPGSSGSMVSGEYSSGEGPRGSPGEGPRPDINGSSSSGSGDWGAEKLKWWFGLPNRYYDSSWK